MQNPSTQPANRDLVLSPDTYLFLQSEAKSGNISIHVGPTVVNQTGQDKPVRFDAPQNKFHQCELRQAVQQFPRAGEGDYVIIENPAENGKFPTETQNQAAVLEKGRRIVIPGPWSQALFPGQSANVIAGHRLRTNQYLVVTIYNEDQAKGNWDQTIIKSQTDTEETKSQSINRGLPRPQSFAVGTRIIIKGTEVSFYIPCTGVEVVPEKIDTSNPENTIYVREAVTLEQLEYCCLIDESGKKEYPRGPQVVFPEPTQTFSKDNRGRAKFRPIELNKINGIHLKVTADFEDEDYETVGTDGRRPSRKYQEGEELFVTGKTLQIYYPREELSIIEYGKGNKKHFSTAIPKGEGRYVIERETGKIDLVRGYKMFLADPRTQIPVRRVLSSDDCALWYPGNLEALRYNLELAEAVAESPSGRSGVISEGDWRKKLAQQAGSEMGDDVAYLFASGSYEAGTEMIREASYGSESSGDEPRGKATSKSITRGTKYTQPRTLTLNTKYDGVPRIEVWPGYAVLIVGAEGNRRVVEGPAVELLEYDEKLGHFYLSTGKPKTTDQLKKDVYLCIHENQVGDSISFESKDHVRGTVKISMRVNFESQNDEDKLKWFSVDNYVKYLTDHVRSIIAGMSKRKRISEIKDNYVDLVRDAILGSKGESGRGGMFFESNMMRVVEVEVLNLSLEDRSIATMLDDAQIDVVRSNIELDRARKDLETTKEKERIIQEKLEAEYTTTAKEQELQRSRIEDSLAVSLTQIVADLERTEKNRDVTLATETTKDKVAEMDRARKQAENEILLAKAKAEQELKKELLTASTESDVKRFEAAKDGLGEVLTNLTREEMATRLAASLNIERFLSGGDGSTESSLVKLLSFSPLLKQALEGRGDSNGHNRLKQAQSQDS